MRSDRGEDWHASDEDTDAFLARFFPDDGEG